MPEATSTAFDPDFISTLPRWIGRVVSSASWQDNIIPENFDNENEIKGWGYRFKVRIIGWHTSDKQIVSDDELTIANIIYPVTAGSGHGGYAETPSIAAGSIVTGFFLDGAGGEANRIGGLGGSFGGIADRDGSCITNLDRALPVGVKENASCFCSFCEFVGEGFACEGGLAGGIKDESSSQPSITSEIISIDITFDGVVEGCAISKASRSDGGTEGVSFWNGGGR